MLSHAIVGIQIQGIHIIKVIIKDTLYNSISKLTVNNAQSDYKDTITFVSLDFK